MIRVLVVDDHELVRSGIGHLVDNTDDITVVGEAAHGDQALERAAELAPDVVLMDLEMPGMDGVEATARLRETSPQTSVVVLTSFSDRERILAALHAGAVGYLLKDAEPADLLQGLRAAAAGESPLAPKAARAVLDAHVASSTRPRLTARERDVLALVGEGLPNKLIARQLSISEKTVKAHLTHAFSTIGVTDRTAAALWVRENGT